MKNLSPLLHVFSKGGIAMRAITVFCASCLLIISVSKVTAQVAKEKPGQLINVNTASQEELEKLPGIGPAKAQEIIREREKSPFRTVDDLTRVKGIKTATLDKFRVLVTVSGSSRSQPGEPHAEGDGAKQKPKEAGKEKLPAGNEEEKESFERPQWATLVASTKSKPLKYHRPECSNAQKIIPENRIWFANANDATQSGHIPAECKDKKCQPPKPDEQVQVGPIGGHGLQPPGPNPPEVPQRPAPPPQVPQRPAHPPTEREIWQNVSTARELEARKKWDIWATWALDRWCERWHVTSSGKIKKNAAYPADVELKLMERFKEMKAQIDDNKKRIKELERLVSKRKDTK